LVVRAAEVRDIKAMIALLRDLFAIEADFGFDAALQRRGLKLLLASPTAQVFVAEINRMVIGMCTAQWVISTAEGGRSGWVEDVVVAPPFRGRGVGEKLLGAVEEWAAVEGITRLQLLADRGNQAAHEFYRKRGWTETRMVAFRKKEPFGAA
jgi:GNAT superfamily N-acetyltransferase